MTPRRPFEVPEKETPSAGLLGMVTQARGATPRRLARVLLARGAPGRSPRGGHRPYTHASAARVRGRSSAGAAPASAAPRETPRTPEPDMLELGKGRWMPGSGTWIHQASNNTPNKSLNTTKTSHKDIPQRPPESQIRSPIRPKWLVCPCFEWVHIGGPGIRWAPLVWEF